MKKLLLLIALVYTMIIGGHLLFSDQPGHDAVISKEHERSESGEEKEEGKTDQPSKFLQFHEGIRTRADQATPQYRAGYKWSELKRARLANARVRQNARTATNGVLEWKERGPANVPGRTRAIFNIPGDPSNQTWLAGAATGGIWRTTDGGLNWSERSRDFPAIPISSFGADNNATVIYAGTGELVSSFYSAIGNGIFKSTDKGVTWTQLSSTNNNPDFSIVTRLIVKPDDPNVIVATTAPHNTNLADETSAIMRSTDGGATWTKVKEVTGIFEQITFTPANFNVQYASQNSVGIWKSVDGGVTWNLSSKGMSPEGRIEISVSPANGNVIYASAEGTLSGTESDLYYSTDAGANWSLVNVVFQGNVVDFFEGQGFYDNTLLADPFNSKSVYVGGVSMFKVTLTSGSVTVDNYKLTESGTEPYIFLQSFSDIPFDRQRLDVGPNAGKARIEIRFGPGESQKAHRFQVPVDKTNGVQPNEYAYQNYSDVPFEVWDVTANKQLMVSYRDQNRNGQFDLVPVYLTNDGIDYLQNSREYFYIHDVPYGITANASIAQNGGHEHKLAYNIFPALADNATWNPSSLPPCKIIIDYFGILKYSAGTVTVADGRGDFDNKNKSNQIDLSKGVHPDHHCLAAVITDAPTKNYKLIMGNDGGVFVSKSGLEPGTTEGDWTFRGFGLNTGQFYGADKSPAGEFYIGGMQDNGTRISPKTGPSDAATHYNFALDGDGFEVLWHSKDPLKLLSTSYYGQISKSVNGGSSWKGSSNGDDDDYPFVTKLATSKDFPDRVFTAGAKGVYVSDNFGDSWKLTAIPEKFLIGTSTFLDVEVSRANPNIVWAGSGMNNTGTLRTLFVSKDGGKTFQGTNNYMDQTLGNITKLASHPTEPNTAYALFSFAKSPKILRTKDLGVTWEDISGFGANPASSNGFPDVAVYSLYVRADNPDIIWAGTEIGIVESLDNGVSWNVLDDFPNVSVWDMKGQDDEVVLATHGRGIWTAKLVTTQTPVKGTEMLAAGTTPQGHFAVRLSNETPFDSVKVYVNGVLRKTIIGFPPQTVDVTLTGVAAGGVDVKVFSYIQGAPYQSRTFTGSHHQILAVKNSYSTYFSNIDDLAVKGMSVQNLEGTLPGYMQSLQTNHPYSPNEQYEVLVRTPIKISEVHPTLYYEDVAIVEPGQDLIVVEGTTNGLDWTELTEYDATFNPAWQSAFSENTLGSNNMFVKREIDLSTSFDANEIVLFRLRFNSNNSVTSWGWAVEHITLQEIPTAIEDPIISGLEMYPNPVKDNLTVRYGLDKNDAVTIEVLNIYGATLDRYKPAFQNNTVQEVNIGFSDKPAGVYVILLRTKKGKIARKVLKEN